MQHVFLVGAKSLGAYGGYETFVNKLTEYHQNNPNIKYHVAVKANGQGASVPDGVKVIDGRFVYHNADCFQIPIPERLGSAQAIYYDCAALKKSIEIIKEENISNPIIYILACRIGPFIKKYYKKIHEIGGKVFLNPDGHEWMRAKWSAPIKKYWKLSEKCMVKWSDLDICDSVNIESYIHDEYDGKGISGVNPKTVYIAYGADLSPSIKTDGDVTLTNWYKKHNVKKKDYYLIVGRFVPENSYEVMIREFIQSKTDRDLVIITNIDKQYFAELEKKLHFSKDSRIKFVGTVYDQELLKKIRENAYAYLHGHTVGGTNPSLIEALGSTDLNLLVDVVFNKEVAENCALYWSKEKGDLSSLINLADLLSPKDISKMGNKARKHVSDKYTWEKICKSYEQVFVSMERNQ